MLSPLGDSIEASILFVLQPMMKIEQVLCVVSKKEETLRKKRHRERENMHRTFWLFVECRDRESEMWHAHDDQRPTNKPNVSHNIFEMRKVVKFQSMSRVAIPVLGDHLNIINTNCHGSKFQQPTSRENTHTYIETIQPFSSYICVRERGGGRRVGVVVASVSNFNFLNYFRLVISTMKLKTRVNRFHWFGHCCLVFELSTDLSIRWIRTHIQHQQSNG